MTLTTAGLTNGGVTAHYKFQYDDSLKAGGLEPDRTNAVIAACEGDFSFMRGSFGNIDLGVNIPISVHIIPPGRDGACADPGGCGSLTSSGNLTVTVSDKELKTADASVIRYVIVAEIVEIFMRAQAWAGLAGRTRAAKARVSPAFSAPSSWRSMDSAIRQNGTGTALNGLLPRIAWTSSTKPTRETPIKIRRPAVLCYLSIICSASLASA
jgi:hypothetical protein